MLHQHPPVFVFEQRIINNHLQMPELLGHPNDVKLLFNSARSSAKELPILGAFVAAEEFPPITTSNSDGAVSLKLQIQLLFKCWLLNELYFLGFWRIYGLLWFCSIRCLELWKWLFWGPGLIKFLNGVHHEVMPRDWRNEKAQEQIDKHIEATENRKSIQSIKIALNWGHLIIR